MKRLPVLLALLALARPAPCAAQAQAPAEGVTVASQAGEAGQETPAQRDARMRWWREAKFGLFIHWGVYAVPAGKYGDKDAYGEWIMNSAKIPVAEYRTYAQRFDPVKYDPVAWARLAKDAGMRYVVITSKHHDGFALYPSDASTWDVADASPWKKDLLRPLVDAVHGEGLRMGFYYSQAQDWMNPGGAKSGYPEGGGWDAAHKGDFDAYLTGVAAPQVRELLTRYPLDILWWDTPTWMNARRTAPLAALTSLRPGIVTNNRLGPGFGGDTATPEQFVPVTGIAGDWETCMTMNGHWGYNAADTSWKSTETLVRTLADIVSKGGNFLLNVGPTAEGEIPAASVERLRAMGVWLTANGESIYGTSRGPFQRLSWGVATRQGGRLYLHVFDWPKDGALRVPLRSAVKRASLLGRPGAELPLARESERVVVKVPATAPDPVDTVVVLELGAEPLVAPLPSDGKAAAASSAEPDAPAANVLDGTARQVWRAAEGQASGWVEVDLGAPAAIAGFAFDEPDVWPRLKQRFRFEVAEGSGWNAVASGDTVGHGWGQNVAPVTAQRFRLALERDGGAPAVAELQLYGPE
jgi:alpha-L-fucosidase